MNRHYLYQMVLKMVFASGGEIIFNIKLWLLKHEKKLLECWPAQLEKSFTRSRTGNKYFFEGGLALVFYDLLVEETVASRLFSELFLLLFTTSIDICTFVQ